MILYRYSTKDGEWTYPRGKTEALRECRKHAKLTPSNVTLKVEAVELRALTGKTMILALLNGEDVVAEDEEGEPQATLLAEVRGKLKPQKPQPQPRPAPPPVTGDKPRSKRTPFAQVDDPDDQEYVTVYGKQGWRLVKFEELRPGMFVETSHPTLAGRKLPKW